MYVEADIHQVKCKLLVDTGATVSIVSNDIYQKIPDVARPTLTPSFPAYLRLTRLPSTSNILLCKSIKPAFDLKQSKPIIPSTVICATKACTTISIRGTVDDSANKLTYETDMLVEANETFLKKDKALVGRSLVQASEVVVLLDVQTL
jgi:hypothetical protein